MTLDWTREEPGLYTSKSPRYVAAVAKCSDGWAWHVAQTFGNLRDEGYVGTLARAKQAAETAVGYFPA